MIDKLRSDLDIRLLRTLHLLLSESSVSRVAGLLGQPARRQRRVEAAADHAGRSTACARRRRAAGAERARCAADRRGRRILADFDRLFDGQGDFDPRTVRRHAHIVASNCLGALLLPRIVELVRAQAPLVDLDLCPRPGDDEATLRRRLETGEIDVVIGNWPSPSDVLRLAPLLDTEIVCMIRPSHRLARAEASRSITT